MKKAILAMLAILPFGNISVASTIKLNELDQDQKVELMNTLIDKSSPETQDRVENDKAIISIDQAIKLLLKDSKVKESLMNKKEGGGGSGWN